MMSEDRVKRVAEELYIADNSRHGVSMLNYEPIKVQNNYEKLARAAMAAILTPDEEREIEYAAAEVEGFDKLGSEILTALLKDLQGEKA